MEIKHCAVCGTAVEVCTETYAEKNVLHGLDYRGYDDDGSMAVLKKRVVCCPGCGYCMPPENFATYCIDKEVVKMPEYRNLLRINIPVYARYYLCCAFIFERRKRWKEAAYSALRGVWVCDSVGCVVGANYMRDFACSYLGKYILCSEKVFCTEHIIYIDLIRRNGRYFCGFYKGIVGLLILYFLGDRNVMFTRMVLQEIKMCLLGSRRVCLNWDIFALERK